jgi:hypothetical protein
LRASGRRQTLQKRFISKAFQQRKCNFIGVLLLKQKIILQNNYFFLSKPFFNLAAHTNNNITKSYCDEKKTTIKANFAFLSNAGVPY